MEWPRPWILKINNISLTMIKENRQVNTSKTRGRGSQLSLVQQFLLRVGLMN